MHDRLLVMHLSDTSMSGRWDYKWPRTNERCVDGLQCNGLRELKLYSTNWQVANVAAVQTCAHVHSLRVFFSRNSLHRQKTNRLTTTWRQQRTLCQRWRSASAASVAATRMDALSLMLISLWWRRQRSFTDTDLMTSLHCREAVHHHSSRFHPTQLDTTQDSHSVIIRLTTATTGGRKRVDRWDLPSLGTRTDLYPRDAIHKRGICCRSTLQVRVWLSVKLFNLSSKFFHHLTALIF